MSDQFSARYRGYLIDFEPRELDGQFIARVVLLDPQTSATSSQSEVHEPHIAAFRLQSAAAAFGRRYGELLLDAMLDDLQQLRP